MQRHETIDLLVPVGSRLERTSGGDVEVSRLLRGELGELGSELGEMEGGDLLVEVLGQHVDLVLVSAAGPLVPELELGNDLVGEGARHDK